MIDTMDLWINVIILLGMAGLVVLLARAICHLRLLSGGKRQPWELVRLPNGTLIIRHDWGATRFNGVRVENSKIAKLILEAATLDDPKEGYNDVPLQ